MTKQEHLLTVAMEECAEIQQAISKALRFGLDGGIYEVEGRAGNELDIIEEYYQLRGVFELLFADEILHEPDVRKQRKIIENKMTKVKKYMELSQERGCIKV